MRREKIIGVARDPYAGYRGALSASMEHALVKLGNWGSPVTVNWLAASEFRRNTWDALQDRGYLAFCTYGRHAQRYMLTDSGWRQHARLTTPVGA